MKKTFSTIVIATLAFTTMAQGPQLAVQASPLFTVFSAEGESLNGLGFSAGLSLKLPIGKYWSIRPEINMQQRSFVSDFSSEYTSANYRYTEEFKNTTKLSFLDMPILFEYRKNTRLGFYVGPQFGTDIGAKYLSEYNSMEEDLTTGQVYEIEGTDEAEWGDGSLLELSLALGTNYNLDNGLSFEFRLQRSLAMMQFGDVDTDMAMLNMQLGLRYVLPTGKKD